MLEKHIDEALKVLASGFADQKGAAYGFGPKQGTEPDISQVATLEQLDKFHTHSKSIENAFGHLDNLLRQAGPRVLKKTVQSMQISSAKDLVFDGSNSWRKMPVPKRKQLKDVKEKWNSSQQKLIDHGVKDSDANALQHQDADKIDSIDEKHGGPLNSDKDIETFQKKNFT